VGAYIQQLMIRNARIIFPEEGRPVDLVLGMLGSTPSGGGTGHGFRLARAAGVPTFDLRDADVLAAARAALRQRLG